MGKKNTIKNGKWERRFDYGSKFLFTITTERFIIHITGGSVVIKDKVTGNELNKIKGFNYLYTGDVNPDETELFALENGKHFFIFSLDEYKQKLRVTLPRSYEAIDVYGEFSADGSSLYVPVYKYVNNKYKYWLCEYDTKDYSLKEMKEIEESKVNHWL